MTDNAPRLNPKNIIQPKYQQRLDRMFDERSETRPEAAADGEAGQAPGSEDRPRDDAASLQASSVTAWNGPAGSVVERAPAANQAEEGRAPAFPWTGLSATEAAREKRATVSMDQKTEMMVEWILDRTPRMSKNRLLKGWLKKAAEDEVRRLRRKGLD